MCFHSHVVKETSLYVINIILKKAPIYCLKVNTELKKASEYIQKKQTLVLSRVENVRICETFTSQKSTFHRVNRRFRLEKHPSS